MLASQRIESVIDFSNNSTGEKEDEEVPTKRGATPTLIELVILSWVSGKKFLDKLELCIR
jgi:transient receptor potential cation channel subfamily C member 4